MRRNILFALTAGLCVAAAAQAAPAENPAGSAPPFSTAITAPGFRAYDQAISSDYMDGRKPGTVGGKRATAWIVEQFKKLGLQPGNHGSWFQAVPTVSTALQSEDKVKLDVSEGGGTQAFDFGKDLVAMTLQAKPHVAIKDSDIVFVGYGIDAPEWQWNDYKGLDVKGKTVVVLVNDPGYATGNPELFKGKTMTYYGRWTYKYEEAARQGAAAILIVHDTEPAGYPWEVVQGSWSGPLEELPPGKGYHTAIQGWLSHDAATRLFAAAGVKLEDLTRLAAKRGFKAIPLKLRLSVTLKNQVKPIVSHNVVGLVKGTRNPEDVVVYSAHWDHLGQRTGAGGKTEIFHGAIDNGSGIAALLEIARVMAQSKPERSVLFLATTSEEQGLLGAEYYAAHPLIPLKHTVADLNMDVLDTFGKTRDETVRGKFMSGVDDAFVAEAKGMGLAVEQDAQPEKGYYYRADHFEFAKAGVPAMSIALGTDYVGHPASWGLEQQRAYTATRYHKPADVYSADWDLAGMLQQVELMYRTGHTLADSDDWPAWRPGIPFEATRRAERP